MAIYFDYPSIQDYSAIVGISSEQFSNEYTEQNKDAEVYKNQQQISLGDFQTGDNNNVTS